MAALAVPKVHFKVRLIDTDRFVTQTSLHLIPSKPDHPMLGPHDRLQELTREYSRYSRSAGGMAAVAGGVLCLAGYLAGGLLEMSLGLQVALIAMPVFWLVLKQGMAHYYYQWLGQVEEFTSPGERRTRLAITALVALISVVVVATFLLGAAPIGNASWDLRTAGYVSMLAGMPVIAWYWLRNPLELTVGVFLFCQAALAFAGQSYPLWSSAIVFPFAAVLLIATGFGDHRRFLAIRAEIRALVLARQESA